MSTDVIDLVDVETPSGAPPKRVKPHSSLFAWRRGLGLTQRAAALALGISQSYYWKLERGTVEPRRGILKRLTDVTGVPVDILMRVDEVIPNRSGSRSLAKDSSQE
jgi:transcriptional regulator with XRE-family HTH domain